MLSPTAQTLPSSPRQRSYVNVVGLLRLEGLLAGGLAIGAYAALHASWWLFGALILAPDLAALAYIVGPRAGRWAYNAAHTYLAPALLAAIGYGGQVPLLLALAAIWAAHIGLDRAMGYGLKLESFRHTHLSQME